MVAQTTEESQTRQEGDESATRGHPHRLPRGGLRRLIASSLRLVDVQYKIMLLRAKMTVTRLVIYAALLGAAVVLGLLGLIFLYIGIFRLLTDLAGLPAWATFLIYAGVHVITAVALMFGGARAIAGKDEDDEDEKKKDAKPDGEGSR